MKTNKKTGSSIIKINAGEKMVELETKKLVFLEAHINYTFLHTLEDIYVIARTLKNYEEKLSENHFVRIHKSYLINKSHIKKITKNKVQAIVSLSNGVKLQVSRRRLKEFIEKTEKY